MRALRWWVPLLVLAGCGGEPEDLFFFGGDVQDVSGAALAGIDVELLRSTDEHCYPTFGDDDIPSGAPYEPFMSARTDEQGRYLFEVMRFQIEDPRGFPYCLRAQVGRDGAVTELRFSGRSSDQQLPTLTLWTTPGATVLDTETGWRITRTALPFPEENVPGTVYDYGADPRGIAQQTYYDWSLVSAAGRAWLTRSTAEPLEVRRELFEDYQDPAVILEALASRSTSGDAITGVGWNLYHLRIASPPIPLGTPGTAAFSRGRECWLNSRLESPCPATDGELRLSMTQQPVPDGSPLPSPGGDLLRLDLGSEVAANAIILRDFRAGGGQAIAIEASVDGETWANVGSIARLYDPDAPQPQPGIAYHPELRTVGRYLLLPLEVAGGTLRHVRLRGSESDRIYGLREASVAQVPGLKE